jgi:hypothetical protein
MRTSNLQQPTPNIQGNWAGGFLALSDGWRCLVETFSYELKNRGRADWQSAIPQTGSLRYGPLHRVLADDFCRVGWMSEISLSS